MANNTEDLIFQMGISTNLQSVEKDWAEKQKKIQAIIDKTPFNIELKFNDKYLKDTRSLLSEISKMYKDVAAAPKSSPAAMLTAKTIADAKAAAIAKEAESKANLMAAKTEAVLSAQRDKSAVSIENQRAAQDRANAAKTRAEIAGLRLQHAQTKQAASTDFLTRSMNRHNTSLIAMSGVLDGIPQVLNSYVSALGAFRIYKNIREVTAEFELQKVALGAIIQDTFKANALFNQVVELGIRSPFQIKELITYTKQLAAYRVETENLFETTSRLADISAGLGVDMSRLILAYGQVRAASVLRGQEIRQFTEAGIPLVDLLAKKFTQLNGQVTTTGDVFELVSKRMVPFTMIKEIFEDMTNAGGVFYNMQAIQAKTLRGVYSNLRDAYDKMFMQMGEANMGLLKGMGMTLRMLADNWEIVLDIAQASAISYGAFRLAVLANNIAQGKELAATMATAKANKIKEASMLRISNTYRKLTLQERILVNSANQLRAVEIQRLVLSGKISKNDVLRQIAIRKINAERAKELVLLKVITQAEVDRALATSKGAIIMATATNGLRSMAVALKATTVAMLSNPFTWFIAGIAAVIAIGSKLISHSKKYKELTQENTRISRTYVNELRDSYRDIEDIINTGLKTSSTQKDVQDAISALTQILDKNESLKPIVAERLKNAKDEVTQLTELKKLYEDIVRASNDYNPIIFTAAQKDTGGAFFDKDIIETSAKLNQNVIDINETLLKLKKNGADVGFIERQFTKASKAFQAGEISIKEFDNSLISLLKDARPISTTLSNEFVSLRNRLRSFSGDVGTFNKAIKASFREINGQKITWTEENFGLSDENFNALITKLALYKENWFRTLTDLQEGTRGALDKSFNVAFLIPQGGQEDAGKKLSAFAEEYNAFIKSKGINLVMPLEPSSEKSTFKDVSENIETELASLIKLRDQYTSAIKGGLKYAKKDIDATNEKIRQYQMIADFLGIANKETSKAATKDPRVDALEKEVSLIEDAYKKYEQYMKLRGSSKAKELIKEMYQGRVTTDGLSLAFSEQDMEKNLKRAMDLFSSYGKGGSEAYFKTWNTQADITFKSISSKVKKEMQTLSQELQQMQQANEFYEKMLGITGDENLSKQLALDITGLDTGDISENLTKQLKSAVENIGLTEIPMTISGRVDVTTLREQLKLIDPEKVGEEAYNLIKSTLDAYVGHEAKSAETLFAGLDKFGDYEKKKSKIISDAEKNREKARKLGQDSLLPAIDKKEQIDLSSLEYETFKTTSMYVEMFGKLDRVTTQSLEAMKKKLIELSGTVAESELPSNMKEIITKIDSINTEIIKRNPFKAWADSLREAAPLQKAADSIKKKLRDAVKDGLSEGEIEGLSLELATVEGQLQKVAGDTKESSDMAKKELQDLISVAMEVTSSVREIFEEFNIGQESIAGRSLSIIEAIGSGVSKVIQVTSKTAAASISAVEKASVILAIISAVIQVAMAIYKAFSKEATLSKQIEGLTKDVEYLQSMYDKLTLQKVLDYRQLDLLRNELGLRKQLLETTQAQMQAEIPDANLEMRDSILQALGLKMTADPINALTMGVKSWINAFIQYGKMKKFGEYIGEANKRIEYQTNLMKILNSDMNNLAKVAKSRSENLKEQNRLLQQQIDLEIARGRKMDVGKILDLQQEMAKNDAAMLSAYSDTLQEAVGDVFSNLITSISDGLAAAFENGESSAKAFENTVDKVMRNVVIDLWRVNVLSKLIEPLMGKVYNALGLDKDGKAIAGSTPDYYIDANEAKNIAKEAAAAKKNVTSSWDGLKGVLDIFDSDIKDNLTGISKAASGMSEESALTIAGYANSLLYYSVAKYNISKRMLEIMESGSLSGVVNQQEAGTMINLYNIQVSALDQLRMISFNTENTASNTRELVNSINRLSLTGGNAINVRLTS